MTITQFPKGEIAAARTDLLERIRRLNQVVHVGTVMAGSGKRNWPVRIMHRAGEYFEVYGCGSSMDVYLAKTTCGYLVSLPNLRRCGHVPPNCNSLHVAGHIGIDNPVDAVTLSVAIRYLIERGLN